MLDEAERAPAGVACWMQPASVGRGDGVEAGVGRGDEVEGVHAAERATAGAACWTQPKGRRPRLRVGCSQAGVSRGDEVEASVGQGGWGLGRGGGADGASAGADACVGRREGWATGWRWASAGANGASAGEVGRMGRRPGRMRASGIGRWGGWVVGRGGCVCRGG